MKDTGAIASHTVAIVEEYVGRCGWKPRDAEFLGRIEKFVATLALWGRKLNLTAAPEDPSEIAFHVIDSLAPLLVAATREDFSAGRRLIDLGSGAGFPGLVLASACDAEFTLLEARRKRASFLTVAAAAMGLKNVKVDATRRDAETLVRDFDVATGRAFAHPEVFLATAASALRANGYAILFANPSQRAGIEQASSAGSFQNLQFIEYEVPRGGRMVAHLLAVARRAA